MASILELLTGLPMTTALGATAPVEQIQGQAGFPIDAPTAPPLAQPAEALAQSGAAPLGAAARVLRPGPSPTIGEIERRATLAEQEPEKPDPKFLENIQKWGVALQSMGLGLAALRPEERDRPAPAFFGGAPARPVIPTLGAFYPERQAPASILAQYLR